MGRDRAGVPDKRMTLRALCVRVVCVCVCVCVCACVCVCVLVCMGEFSPVDIIHHAGIAISPSGILLKPSAMHTYTQLKHNCL